MARASLMNHIKIDNGKVGEVMTELKCDICGGKLIMQANGLAKCESCGMEYSKESLRGKAQEVTGTVKVDGSVETVHGESEKERLLENADVYLSLGKGTEAYEIYNQVTRNYPSDYRGWWGRCKANNYRDDDAFLTVLQLIGENHQRTDICSEYFANWNGLSSKWKSAGKIEITEFISAVITESHRVMLPAPAEINAQMQRCYIQDQKLLMKRLDSGEVFLSIQAKTTTRWEFVGFEELLKLPDNNPWKEYYLKGRALAKEMRQLLNKNLNAHNIFLSHLSENEIYKGSITEPRPDKVIGAKFNEYGSSTLLTEPPQYRALDASICPALFLGRNLFFHLDVSNEYNNWYEAGLQVFQISILPEKLLQIIKENYVEEYYASPRSYRRRGCYIASAVYGSYDCPQVWTLRRFRDNILAKSWCGRAFIYTYYAISPAVVKWFSQTSWFNHFWKSRLDKLVNNLHDKGVSDKPYQDQQ